MNSEKQTKYQKDCIRCYQKTFHQIYLRNRKKGFKLQCSNCGRVLNRYFKDLSKFEVKKHEEFK